MRLDEKVRETEKEVGLVPIMCLKYPCGLKYFHGDGITCSQEYLFEKTSRVTKEPVTIGVCIYKIEEYWKK